MLLLILTHGNFVGSVNKNVCSHENRVGEQSGIYIFGMLSYLLLE
jgi:hypothetical protein